MKNICNPVFILLVKTFKNETCLCDNKGSKNKNAFALFCLAEPELCRIFLGLIISDKEPEQNVCINNLRLHATCAATFLKTRFGLPGDLHPLG